MADELPIPADPRASLRRQIELLERVRSGVADVMQSRKNAEEHLAVLGQLQAEMWGQVEKARQMGREDLAQQANGLALGRFSVIYATPPCVTNPKVPSSGVPRCTGVPVLDQAVCP